MKRPKVSLREIFYGLAIGALLTAWLVDHFKQQREIQRLGLRMEAIEFVNKDLESRLQTATGQSGIPLGFDSVEINGEIVYQRDAAK